MEYFDLCLLVKIRSVRVEHFFGSGWVGLFQFFRSSTQLNVEQAIFRTSEISNIKRMKDELIDFVIFD